MVIDFWGAEAAAAQRGELNCPRFLVNQITESGRRNRSKERKLDGFYSPLLVYLSGTALRSVIMTADWLTSDWSTWSWVADQLSTKRGRRVLSWSFLALSPASHQLASIPSRVLGNYIIYGWELQRRSWSWKNETEKPNCPRRRNNSSKLVRDAVWPRE